MSGKVVPFGKYKGKPIEALAQDRQYTDWLVAQPWFREKFSSLYTVVINNFGEASTTPEHNALQARFLDERFRLAFAREVHGYGVVKEVGPPAFEDERGADVVLCATCLPWHRWQQEHYETRRMEWHHALDTRIINVQIKPTVADDYPAIMRQMRGSAIMGIAVLFLEEYIGVGVTPEQFREIFESQYKVVFLDEVLDGMEES